ncbi:MAG: hypothetical protein WD053_08375 [Gracilimonas sp.]
MLFGTKDVFLDESQNENFFQFLKRREELIEAFNKLNGDISKRYVPDNVTRKDKYAYDLYANRVRVLQQQMVDYENDALSFLMNPKFDITFNIQSSQNNQDFIRSHAIEMISTFRTEIINSKNILVNNYESLILEAESARNFKLAKRSYWIAILGLFLALIGLLFTIIGT